MLKKQLLACFFAGLGLLHFGAASAVSLNLVPNNLNAVESMPFDVDVVVSDLAGEVVSLFDITIGYDPLLLSADSVQYSGNLGLVDLETFTLTDLSTPGQASIAEVSILTDLLLEPLQPGDSVTVATLTFLPIDVGAAMLDLLFWAVGGSLEDPSDPNSARDITPDITDVTGANVDISAIPIPGAMWMMLTGLLGIGTLLRRHRGN